MTKWVTISEASVILGVSERTIWRRIREGALEAEIEGGRRLVKVEISADNSDKISATMSDNTDMMSLLKNELSKQEGQIKFLQEEIIRLRDSIDNIVMKLTEELEAQRLFFQDIKLDKKKDKSFWKLLGKSGDDSGAT